MLQEENEEESEEDSEEDSEESPQDEEAEELQQQQLDAAQDEPNVLECPIAKALSAAVPTNLSCQSTPVTIMINNKERVFTRCIPDAITNSSKNIHIFKMNGHDEEYAYGQLYYYVPYNGRLSNIGKSFAYPHTRMGQRPPIKTMTPYRGPMRVILCHDSTYRTGSSHAEN